MMERAERETAERVTGISNVTYDLISMLQNKLEAITVCEIYIDDANAVGNTRVATMFEHCRATDLSVVQSLRKILRDELNSAHDEVGDEITSQERGGDLKSRDTSDVMDEGLDASFPASDPPSYSGTTTN